MGRLMAKRKVTSTEPKKELTVVERAKKFFDRAKAYEEDQRRDELDDIRFAGMLEQWPAALKAIREGDPTGARPCLVVDKINQYKNQIVNQMRQNRPSIKARPVDDNGDIEVAEVYQGIIRHIEDSSKADIAYDWAGEGAVTSGVGYFRILTEYVGDSFQQEIKIQRIRNRFTVYFDPDSKEPDGSDQKECLITMMIKRTEFQEQYPGVDVTSWVGQGDNDWYDVDHVRIAEYYYVEKEKATLYLLDDGNSIFSDEYEEKYPTPILDGMQLNQQVVMPPKILKEREGYRTKVKWCKLSCADEPLEETEVPGVFIPVIRVIGIETDIDGKLHLRGIVRGVKDAQRMYNYQRSTVVESLGLASKAPYVAAAGQVEGFEGQWASSNRVNYGVLKYKPVSVDGTLVPAPQRQGYAGVPTGLVQDMQTSEHDIQAALGMYQASIGQDGNAKSGRALNAQQRAGDMANFQFPDNQSKSVRHAGRVIMGMIPFIYDTAQIVRILGDDGTADYVQINPEQEEAVAQERDENGAINKIYNLGVGKYDVTITTGPSNATKRMEAADFLTQLVQTNPDLMPIIGDYLVKSMDMPYAQEIAERMKLLQPPEIRDANAESNPDVQRIKQQSEQMMQAMKQQLEQAHQVMQEMDQEAKSYKDKAESNEAKAQADMMKVQIDAYNAETNRLKVELDALQNANQIDPERMDNLETAIAMLLDQIQPTEQTEVM